MDASPVPADPLSGIAGIAAYPDFELTDAL
jgi:hypothetical protein